MFSRNSTLKSKETGESLPRPAYETYYPGKVGRDRYGEDRFSERAGWLLAVAAGVWRCTLGGAGEWKGDLMAAVPWALGAGLAGWAVCRILVLLKSPSAWRVVGAALLLYGAWELYEGRAHWTVKEAQREAVRRYPQLGVADSPLNREFVSRYRQYQATNRDYFQRNDWPVKLAEECQASLLGTGGIR